MTRVERGRKILNFFKEGRDGKVLVFLDEKDFHVDKHVNRCNSRYIATSVKDAAAEIKCVGRSKHPSKAMMLGAVCLDGQALPPIWIKGIKDGTTYKNILSRKVFPVLDAMYGRGGVYLDYRRGSLPHQQEHPSIPREEAGVRGILVKEALAA